jgi:thymidylate synthase (FAD)
MPLTITASDIIQSDPRLRVKTLTALHNPNQASWFGMHQDYSEGFVGDETPPPEHDAGLILVKRLLSGERGHYGPLEHNVIVFGVTGFPHSVMQQARTHRVGISFDVQSMRYTGSRIVDYVRCINGRPKFDDIFFQRPVGCYQGRAGGFYHYSKEERDLDMSLMAETARRYSVLIHHGVAEEHARGVLAFEYRQNFVVSFNIRSLMHFLDLRAKLDAQLEIQALCELMMVEFEKWTPAIAAYYKEKRWGKARLAP